VETVKAALEQIPTEFSACIIERGMILTGAGALLKNLDKILCEETGVPVTVIEDPLSSVAIGAGKVSEDIALLKKVASQ
jgi:rod shape-determining protein MreB